ncbi:putative cytosol aminopeptidase OS=Tsukamurella paurometabola (strain ATCC 8368 / DSM / CCUG 35730 / CIP 100753 / JCM 10117 / KCTC 9821 / NBRC 16120 / NCIMB 702349 / NCTC 13040) OX=521096 GN=pepA PE=3 SV=1 [Tsukamurella paurometabola]|uniref:Probable cytosol aminopeptidase n=1 Tax=Tsukamurella paurometabola (strain ATCC 8368 / DSM 20162 / CCUG 35730 / CIP 100753 / JCM 10117 / KCTC 9821 / NBRC 16120 / NCIMB 702349 / NCTC 13040) TaxID=521096 RepID=D5UXQ0_TSUPD|nr:leucyl aminopeptidase [Tsukamurella paurometabola]ADG78142.1 Leucyl aminopeptidase [Tsukamurella paurometabola DSM 20162]SUP30376.1 Cytosol aminopeptidase [Tsukamurella paurometabola]
MSTPFTGPEFSLTHDATSVADALVVGVFSGDAGISVDAGVPEAARGPIAEALALVGAKGTPGEAVRVPAPAGAGLGAATVLGVGLGAAPAGEDRVPAETVRRAAGVAGRALDGVGSALTTVSTLDLAATVEGTYLGAYRFTEFRHSSAPKQAPLGAVALLVAEGSQALTEEARGTVEQARRTAAAVALARDFVNTPPNVLSPGEFADRAQRLGAEAGLQVEVFDEEYLAAHGYGGIVGVGQGSSRPPRLVRLKHSSGLNDAKHVALVGKGITFDTGGISIKPAAGMENMTSDMGGAAAVIATVILAAQLNLAVDVTATVPMAENMRSDTAQRPGDVITQYGGTTVEVINTDAEGRLILADAMVRACEDDPDYLIDTATLTGAQMVALGNRTPGVMGTEEFRDRVAALSQAVGENGWPMPFPEELRADLNSRVADLANVSPHRWGGMLTAGVYLQEFVADGVQWAHIDVAGPAFNTSAPWGYIGKGGTGVPVRTLLAVLRDIAQRG